LRSLQTSLLVNRRNKRQANRRYSPSHRFSQVSLGCGSVVAVLMMVGLLLLGMLYARLTTNLPSLAIIENELNPGSGGFQQPTRLYDRTGKNLLYSLEIPGIPHRYLSLDPAKPEHLSPQLVQATIQLNDPTFWQNPGFAWWKLTSPQPITLAERLVDDLLLETESPGLSRTLRMRLLAAQLVAQFGRSRVLEWYLNSANYGHLAYGADKAAQLYLGKSASQLSLAEAVLLAVTAQAPALNPHDARSAALERKQAALDQLASEKLISDTEARTAESEPINLKPPPEEPQQAARAFDRLVLTELADRFGHRRVERGGLSVTTSLDMDLQLQLLCATRTQLLRLEGQPVEARLPGGVVCDAARLLPTLPPGLEPLPKGLQSSGAVIDLKTGELLAFLGDSTTSSESAVQIGHQPGSLLTPFVALSGFARGWAPASLVWDIPSTLPAGLTERQNPDGSFHGPQRLRLAVANDYLAPLTRLLEQIGPQNTWHLVEPLGLNLLDGSSNPLDLLFSGGKVRPLDIASAYSTFANLGVQRGERVNGQNKLRPVTILSVMDGSGSPFKGETPDQEQSLIGPQLAYLVHHVLSDSSARWPSLGYPNPLEIGRPAGAKTGQIADGKEVWTVGYTPQRLAVTWLGMPKDNPTKATLEPKMVAGIWYALMQYAHRNLPTEDWSRPEGIDTLQVCNPSGKLPTPACPSQVEEVFLNGNGPVENDNLYRTFQVNRETGRLATVFTPLEVVKEQTYLVVPPDAQEWAKSAGVDLPPEAYDDIQAPPKVPGVEITSPQIFSTVHNKVPLMGTADGEDFESYRVQVGQGLNPSSWVQVGETSTTPVVNGLLAEWDTRASGGDGLYAVRLVVVRQDQRIATTVIQVTVDNTLPVVQVLYPVDGQHYKFPSERQVNLLVDIVEDSAGVDRVEWFINDEKIGETTQPPYSQPWKAAHAGQYTLVVKVYDLAGNRGESSSVTFYMDE
jgi:membrane peptidoglycan carboxypeptidase